MKHLKEIILSNYLLGLSLLKYRNVWVFWNKKKKSSLNRCSLLNSSIDYNILHNFLSWPRSKLRSKLYKLNSKAKTSTWVDKSFHPSHSFILIFFSFLFFFFSSLKSVITKQTHTHTIPPVPLHLPSFISNSNFLTFSCLLSHTLSSKPVGILLLLLLLLLLPLSWQVLFQNLIPVKAQSKALSCISSMIQHKYFFNFIFTHRSEISSKSHFSTDLICFHNLVIAFSFLFFFFFSFLFSVNNWFNRTGSGFSYFFLNGNRSPIRSTFSKNIS